MGEQSKGGDQFPQQFDPYQGLAESFELKSRDPDDVRRAKLAEAAAEAQFFREQRAKDATFRRWREVFLTGY